MHSSPAIGSDGTVYVGSWDNKLYAINGKSGGKLWEFETGMRMWNPPPPSALMARFTSGRAGGAVNDGTVYVGSYDNKLYAIKTDPKA